MSRRRCVVLLVWLTLPTIRLAAGPAELCRWRFTTPAAEGLIESRESVPLSELQSEWRQVHGAEADPLAPELYPRVPEARLVPIEGQEALQLEMLAHGARATVVGAPRRWSAPPRYVLRARVDASSLGTGRARLRLRHLRSAVSGGSLVPVAEEEVATWTSASAGLAVIAGMVPESATHVALAFDLDAELATGPSRFRVAGVELEGRAGLRCRWTRFPVTVAGEPFSLAVTLAGAPRGRSLLSHSARPLAAASAARPVAAAGESEAWAPSGLAARWTLDLSTSEWEAGAHELALAVVDAAAERYTATLPCLVLPARLAPRWPAMERLLRSAQSQLGSLSLDTGDLTPSSFSSGWSFGLRGEGAHAARLGVACGVPPRDWTEGRAWLTLATEPAPGPADADWGLWGPKKP